MIAAVGVLGWGVHGHSKLLRLLLLRGKLECVDLRGNTTHGATRREGVDLAKLLRLEQTHVNVLLVCRSDLLLLLLEQLDLLLNGQLFHCKQSPMSVDDHCRQCQVHTHQWCQLGRTPPMSDVKLAPRGAWYPGLVLLVHGPR